MRYNFASFTRYNRNENKRKKGIHNLNLIKMKTKKLISVSIIVCLATIMFSGCKKDTTPTPTPTSPSTQASKVAMENASAEGAFTDAFRQVDQAVKQQGLKSIQTCCTVSFTPNDLSTYPKDVVIDYGTSCTGDDGVVRSGQILAHLTKAYPDSGSVTTITFNNYYVNSRHITGTERITNVGRNSLGHHVFDVEVQNGNLYSPDGITVYNSVQQREWIEGESTLLDPMDDVYMITGTASGTTTNGVNYTLVISTALRVAVGCAWIESGIVNITEPNIPVISLNYGDGTCDNNAVATCSGYTFNIVMP